MDEPGLKLRARARAMRDAPIEPEKRLWRNLSNSRLGGPKLRRQATIAPFIGDFRCPARRLVVEAGGDAHEAERDARRDARLLVQGYRTIRFTTADVMGDREGVPTEMLAAVARNHPLHPDPSPDGEGLGSALAASS